MHLYDNVSEGIFHSRPNRFIAKIEINGQLELCHVKNIGRCKELLIPGTRVYVNHINKPGRVTRYELIAVWKNERLINIDSQAPNKAFLEYLQSGRYIDGITYIKPEAKHGGSRFDFYVEADKADDAASVRRVSFDKQGEKVVKRRIFIEVKGVTLENDNIALFPDAPTERGVKHMHELIQCIHDGYEAHVVFVIKMCGIKHFSPNNAIHPAFGAALVAADKADVKISAFDCIVKPSSLTIGNPVLIHMKS